MTPTPTALHLSTSQMSCLVVLVHAAFGQFMSWSRVRRVAARASASCLRHDRAISLLQGPFFLGQHAAHLQTARRRSVRKLVCARKEAVEVGPLPLQCLAVHRQLHRVSGPLVDVQGGPHPPQLVVVEPRHEQARAALLLRVRQEVDQAIAASAGYFAEALCDASVELLVVRLVRCYLDQGGVVHHRDHRVTSG